MSISQSVSGNGTSGVVTATMTFVTPSRPHGAGIGIDTYDIPQNAEVKLVCPGSLIQPPLFYVTGRRKSGGMTEWTCCDVVSKTDRLIEFSESDFDENDKIIVSDLLVKIHDQSGIGINAGGLSALINKTFDKDKCVDGLTIRSVFETLAEAMCGYWLAIENKIVFANFGKSVTTSAAVPTAYKAVDLNGTVAYSGVICTDNDAVYTAQAQGVGKKMIVSTDYASQELADSILSMMVGDDNSYTYQSWSCGKGKADEWLYPGQFQFGTQFLVCNNVSMSVTSSGLFFTAAANIIDEDEVGYTSEVNRQLRRKLEFDKINGNVAITGKGLYFFENGYKQMSDEEQKNAKYSFEVEKGIIECSGAMVSKVTPKAAKWNSDKTEATVDYGGKKYKYNIVRDADGNVTDFSKEEIKEESE
ncbi:MAG: hypothetical protein ACI4SF_12775 [Oscillospiraceae bacterium]